MLGLRVNIAEILALVGLSLLLADVLARWYEPAVITLLQRGTPQQTTVGAS
jgi:hypothetical protein